VRAAGAGAAADADEGVRAEARSLTRLLFAKLDALSHFQYAPKPVLEDLAVRADVPALAMEEVAPQARAQSPALWLVPTLHHQMHACTGHWFPTASLVHPCAHSIQ
jgi:U3 small nucleolar ribonucleoprotein component